MALPDAPDRRAPTLYALRGGRALRPGHGRPTARAEPAALGSVAASASAGRSDRRHDDDDGEPRSGKPRRRRAPRLRSEEHTSELQSLMRISYAVFCLKQKNKPTTEE